ncbi:MAG: DUF2577 family protein, partial [Firmicutes bacterium]|nr:DUF2577 family protein [Bacillota bacterium]
MENGMSIKQLIQGLMPEGVCVVQGVVQSASPLKIKIEGDEKLIISEQNTYVPWQLTDYDTEVWAHATWLKINVNKMSDVFVLGPNAFFNDAFTEQGNVNQT